VLVVVTVTALSFGEEERMFVKNSSVYWSKRNVTLDFSLLSPRKICGCVKVFLGQYSRGDDCDLSRLLKIVVYVPVDQCGRSTTWSRGDRTVKCRCQQAGVEGVRGLPDTKFTADVDNLQSCICVLLRCR
jgi:hypothetical protein